MLRYAVRVCSIREKIGFVFANNPILVPTMVINELKRLASEGTDDRHSTARQGLSALTQLIDTERATYEERLRRFR